jgi:hypothetical protein
MVAGDRRACVCRFGILMIVVDPGNWLIALASIVFFGFCATIFTRVLVLRRRAATSRP